MFFRRLTGPYRPRRSQILVRARHGVPLRPRWDRWTRVQTGSPRVRVGAVREPPLRLLAYQVGDGKMGNSAKIETNYF